MRLLMSVLVLAGCGMSAFGEVKTKNVDYQFDGVTFKGQLVWDDSISGKRPGVLVVHEWWGLDDYAKSRAKQLAEMGYVAFACDMYGDGFVAEHPQDASRMASTTRKNADIWRGRAKASLKVLSDFELTDPTRLASIGYCFGGTTSLQLAYTGADLKAVVTFHAAITPLPTPEQLAQVKAKVLVCRSKVLGEHEEALRGSFREVIGGLTPQGAVEVRPHLIPGQRQNPPQPNHQPRDAA